MIKKIVTVGMISASFLTPYFLVESVEPLSTAELASHCAYYDKYPKGVDTTFCIRYIQGFIDGAIATDEKVALNAINESAKSETFSERAIRLRKARQKHHNPTYYAEFCLGTPVPLKEVAEKIIVTIKNRKHNDKELPAREAIYHILRTEYPCKII